MPTLYRIQINKLRNNEEWSNDWIIEDETIDDAEDTANELITFEKQIHQDSVFFTYVRISTVLKGDRYFRHLALNQVGVRNSNDSLPLYCTFRLDLPTADSDPCRKYFRGPVQEGDQTNGFLSAALLGVFNADVATYLATPGLFAKMRSGAGNPVVGGVFSPLVQMRQLHRHKRKKVTPPVTP